MWRKVLIAVGVFGLVYLIVVNVWPGLMGAAAAGRVAKATIEVRSIAVASEQFRISVGRYPTNLNELRSNSLNQFFIDLGERPGKGTNDGRFLDPWNRRYIFVPWMNQSSTGYVASLGRDGVAGGVGEDGDQFVGLTNFVSESVK